MTLTPLEKWHPVSTTGSIEDFLVRNHGSGIVICEITIHRSLVAEGAALATARLQNGDVSVSGLECKGHDENLNELAERAFKELEAHLNRLCAQLISA
ncbi:MAG TPA: hypothetical protein VNG90_04320 [Candidatus Acidoferrum sp.]|nr:hypothetical protein [Candidatus Acidoferrum sp.]